MIPLANTDLWGGLAARPADWQSAAALHIA